MRSPAARLLLRGARRRFLLEGEVMPALQKKDAVKIRRPTAEWDATYRKRSQGSADL